ncbi:MAG: AbrB/MazE/SpoVT family DNA-binding domain-containing protein [Thermoplasmata archaeon]
MPDPEPSSPPSVTGPEGIGPTAPSRDPEDVFRLSRRVQRTGSSLSVTLPRRWIDSSDLHPGDIVVFRELAGGSLELSRSAVASRGKPSPTSLTVEVEGAAAGFLPRAIIGAYVTGYQRVTVHGTAPLTEAQRESVQTTVRRVLGASVVDEAAHFLDIEISVDPTQHDFARLMRRIVHLLEVEIGLCRRSLAEDDRAILNPIASCEDEVDRLYMLMVRQLLLASDDFQVAREAGLTSHRYQMSNRVVAKLLEMIGDLLSEVGRALRALPTRGEKTSPRSEADLSHLLAEFESLLRRTSDAFIHLAPGDANAALNDIQQWLWNQHGRDRRAVHRSLQNDEATVLATLRISGTLATAVEMLVMMNEITINRSVEPESVLRAGPDGRFVLHPTAPAEPPG